MPYSLLDGKAENNISIIGMDDDGPELSGDIRQGCRGEHFSEAARRLKMPISTVRRRIGDLATSQASLLNPQAW
jgi:hypothetical protein